MRVMTLIVLLLPSSTLVWSGERQWARMPGSFAFCARAKRTKAGMRLRIAQSYHAFQARCAASR
jgi:hypothetical protein